MERIELTGNNPFSRSRKGRKTEKKHSGFSIFSFSGEKNKPDDFSVYLDGAVSSAVPLEELLDEVHQAGEKLIDKPFMASILEYKKAVRKFMAHIVSRAYTAETDTEVRKYFKNGLPMVDEKKWVKIKVIDEKLEKLALYIVENQKSQLSILKRIEEIEGLLVDLMG